MPWVWYQNLQVRINEGNAHLAVLSLDSFGTTQWLTSGDWEVTRMHGYNLAMETRDNHPEGPVVVGRVVVSGTDGPMRRRMLVVDWPSDGASAAEPEPTACETNPDGYYRSVKHRRAARTLFHRPYLAHFGSFFRRFFAVLSVLAPGFQKVAPKDRGTVP